MKIEWNYHFLQVFYTSSCPDSNSHNIFFLLIVIHHISITTSAKKCMLRSLDKFRGAVWMGLTRQLSRLPCMGISGNGVVRSDLTPTSCETWPDLRVQNHPALQCNAITQTWEQQMVKKEEKCVTIHEGNLRLHATARRKWGGCERGFGGHPPGKFW